MEMNIRKRKTVRTTIKSRKYPQIKEEAFQRRKSWINQDQIKSKSFLVEKNMKNNEILLAAIQEAIFTFICPSH